MQYAKIAVSGNQTKVTDCIPITAGTVGGTVSFQFDESWEGFQKTLVWQGSGRTIDDASCTGIIPHEVVAKPGGPLQVGVYGTKDNTATPTIWADLGTILSGVDPSGDPSTEPSPPVWVQTKAVAEKAVSIAETAMNLASSAEWDAEQATRDAAKALEVATGAESDADRAISIAEGRATGYVFDTKADMDRWLWGKWHDENGNSWMEAPGDTDPAAEHRAMLNLGDNLYIRDKGVPDYWWDGEKEQELETQKVDLAEYVKNTDYATVGNKAGVVRILNASTGTYGIQAASQNYPGAVLIAKANNKDIDNRTSNYKPIVPKNLDYAVHSVLKKQPKFISSYTGDIADDGYVAARDMGDYVGQIRLQGGSRSYPKRVWMYIGLDGDEIPTWLDLLSGETYIEW